MIFHGIQVWCYVLSIPQYVMTWYFLNALYYDMYCYHIFCMCWTYMYCYDMIDIFCMCWTYMSCYDMIDIFCMCWTYMYCYDIIAIDISYLYIKVCIVMAWLIFCSMLHTRISIVMIPLKIFSTFRLSVCKDHCK